MEETRSYRLAKWITSQPKCLSTSGKFDDSESSINVQILRNSESILSEAEKNLVESIVGDDYCELIEQLNIALTRDIFEGDQKSDPDVVLDRDVVSKLLHLCCAFDSIKCVSALIKGNAGAVPLIDELDATGWSPIHRAADMHATKCIELLFRKGARADIKTKDNHACLPLELALSGTRMDVGWTSNDSVEDLLVCLCEKDLTAVKLLIEKTEAVAEVAYAYASQCRIVALAALLIVDAEWINDTIPVLRPDSDSGPEEKTTVYEYVINEALLLGQNEISSPKMYGWSESDNAGRRKLLLLEMELLQLFGAVDRRNASTATTPLIRATQAGDEAVVRLLLKTKINVNDADEGGNSALHWSVKTYKKPRQQHTRIVCLLLRHGAQVRLTNLLGLTAVHIAASNGNVEALKVLLSVDHGCVDCATEMQETPLFLAVRNDYAECAKLLMCYGANTEALNLRNQRPIDLAKSPDMSYILSPSNTRSASLDVVWFEDNPLFAEASKEIWPINIRSDATESEEDPFQVKLHVPATQSLFTATGRHYFHIKSETVELKTEVLKCLQLGGTGKPSPNKQQELENSSVKPQTASPEKKTSKDRPKQKSSDYEFACDEQKTLLNESRADLITTSDENMPGWVSTFKDHVSLGYTKLSGFVGSMHGLCHMNIVHVGGSGMVLPLMMPNKLLGSSIAAKCIDSFVVEHPNTCLDAAIMMEDHSYLPSKMTDSLQESSQHDDWDANEASQFLEFLKPDPLFHGRPWLVNPNDKDDGRRSRPEKQAKPSHVILEALADIRGSTSVFFLREFDFLKDYWESVRAKNCFACKQGVALWANDPCGHLLWCGDCKLEVVRIVEGFEHKCVVCDVKVVTTVMRPRFELSSFNDFPALSGMSTIR